MSTMGHVVSDDPQHTCDNCESTYTGTWSEVSAKGWVKHTANVSKFIFLMCGDCEAEFARRRKAAKAV